MMPVNSSGHFTDGTKFRAFVAHFARPIDPYQAEEKNMNKKPIPEFLTVEDAGRALGLSRNLAYAAARRYRETGGRQGIPNLKIGGRILVPADALRRMATLPVPGESP